MLIDKFISKHISKKVYNVSTCSVKQFTIYDITTIYFSLDFHAEGDPNCMLQQYWARIEVLRITQM